VAPPADWAAARKVFQCELLGLTRHRVGNEDRFVVFITNPQGKNAVAGQRQHWDGEGPQFTTGKFSSVAVLAHIRNALIASMTMKKATLTKRNSNGHWTTTKPFLIGGSLARERCSQTPNRAANSITPKH